MIIKKLRASFGPLEDKTLQLEPGLNIIYGSNEDGKSSWTAFVRAMLYGIHTKEQDKVGHLAEKNKFRPWSGRQMEGAMEVEWTDKSISIERSALGQSPMKKLNVRYTGSGQEVLELMHENLGETLIGVPEEVFLRGAHIRQGNLKINQTGSLEQRIAALVTTGEEDFSYSDVQSTLSAWQKKQKNKRGGGLIPLLDTEIEKLDAKLAHIKEKSGDYHETSRDLERSTARVEELLRDKAIHEELELRAQRQKIQTAKAQMDEKRQTITELETQLAQTGHNITETDLSKVRESREALSSASVRHTQAAEAKKQAESQLILLEEAKSESGFAEQSMEEAKQTIADIALKYKTAEEKATFKKSKHTIPMAISSVLGVAALSAHMVTDLPSLWTLSAMGLSALLFLVFGVTLLHRMRISRTYIKRSEEDFRKYNVTTLKELDQRFAEYEQLCSESEKMAATLTEAEEIALKSLHEMEDSRAAFQSAVQHFAPQISDLEEGFALVGVLGEIADRRDLAQQEEFSAKQLYDSLRENYVGDDTLPIPADGLTAPVRTKSETLFDLDRVQKDYDRLKEDYGLILGEVRTLGDPLLLEAEKTDLEDKKEKLTEQFNALQLALDVFAEADGEMRSRYSPKLGERAGHYLNILTSGAYKRVVFDQNLHPAVEQAGDSISRDALFLSSGTQDQIYLALRLGICDLTFPEACPIILDDALVSFDEGRMKKALDLLYAIAQKRQVLLFTCHAREALYLKGKEGVNLVRL